MAQAYPTRTEPPCWLTLLVPHQLRRERVFLEERLHAVNKDLEDAERDFSDWFASKNTAVDVKEDGLKAMVENCRHSATGR